MARVSLSRVIRGRAGPLAEMAATLGAPVRVEDRRGRRLFGDAEDGVRHPIEVDGEEVGAVIGGDDAATLAKVLASFYSGEKEKLALAAETLGRYKELTLLYDMSDALSRVLDVEEVAGMVVDQAHRFLRAGGASLWMVDQAGEPPRQVASISSEEHAPQPSALAEDGLEARVLEAGRAELVEGSDDSVGVLCAPLRSGDSVFGLLRVSQGRRAWTSGDLKLVTSMASNAASAISHAVLHRDQLRQQALRGQIERFVSPRLLGAALESPGIGAPERIGVLYCDLGSLARSIAPEASAREVLDSLLLATSIAVDALLAVQATVNVSQSEMLVAAFPHRDGFAASARAAATAGLELRMVLEASLGARPGVGVAATDARISCGDSADHRASAWPLEPLLFPGARARRLRGALDPLGYDLQSDGRPVP